jgi:hypothetical protein
MRTTPRVAGFRSEYPAGFELECMAGFVGIRSQADAMGRASGVLDQFLHGISRYRD